MTPNDDNANAVIAQLQNLHIPPKTFPTTGQDASLVGLQNILKGYQCGTVYKAITAEAQAAVTIALYLRAGEKVPTALVNGSTKDTQANKDVPSVLLVPKWVTAGNMASTVVKDKWVTVADAVHQGSCGGLRRRPASSRWPTSRCSSFEASASASVPSKRSSTSISTFPPAR